MTALTLSPNFQQGLMIQAGRCVRLGVESRTTASTMNHSEQLALKYVAKKHAMLSDEAYVFSDWSGTVLIAAPGSAALHLYTARAWSSRVIEPGGYLPPG